MRLFCFELYKLLRCRFLWILLMIFLAYDGFIVWDTVGRDSKIYHDMYKIIIRTGTDLTENTDKIDALLNSEDEAENYYAGYIKNYEGIYRDFDIRSILNSKISLSGNFYTEGKYYEWLSRNYDRLQERVKQISAAGEDKYAFYPGIDYKVHSILFTSILRTLLLQILILTALTVLYLMDYERIHTTEYLTYSSRTGRKIQFIKWLSGMAMSLLYAVILISISLLLFLTCVPMQGLWKTPVSSFMVMQQRGFFLYPYITFVRLSFGKYLLLSLFAVFLLIILVGMLSGTVQLFFRNSYLTMLFIGILFLGLIALPYLLDSGFLHTAAALNPAAMWYLCGSWFIEYDPAVSFAWSEFITIGVWLIVILIGLEFGKKHFLNINL